MLHQLPQSMMRDAVVSVGTVGHPRTCAPPCEALMKFGKCRMRETCQKCHHCASQALLQHPKQARQRGLVNAWSQGLPFASHSHDPGSSPSNAAASWKIPLTPRGQFFAGGGDGRSLRSSTPPPPSCQSPTDAAMYSCAGDAAGACFVPCDVDLTPSKGSAGHPEGCGPACKYVRRKTGCRDGADCPNCHFCQWRRSLDWREVDQHPQVVISNGSRNHPMGCGTACKYVRRKGGCVLGEDCVNCHLCSWRRGLADGSSGGSTAGLPEEGVCPSAPQWLFDKAMELRLFDQVHQVQQRADGPISSFTIRI
eukprot:TRINITY_DN11214_c0_g1_i2.p1 TRINITY_DN11214_c0_g1~~TRINITY_DN11214_c0_g1_i2.p1  ORF type:complete len:344 (+),score=40.66 TRINITY_DN11214_c0_g1_i2:107-1033(+)